MAPAQGSAAMSVAYAPKGLVGVLTPQANTTVEPEFSILLPPGLAMLNARLTSDKPTIIARLLDYLRDLPAAAQQFANAPIGALAFACTGASYFAGAAEEDALVARMQDGLGIPVITAATAVRDAFHALGATRIGLVSPYPDDLTEAATRYWTERGFEGGGGLPRGPWRAAPSTRSTRCRPKAPRRRWPRCRRPATTRSRCSAPACRH
jgi:maleate isomerase